jgi:hypothetical protein
MNTFIQCFQIFKQASAVLNAVAQIPAQARHMLPCLHIVCQVARGRSNTQHGLAGPQVAWPGPCRCAAVPQTLRGTGGGGGGLGGGGLGGSSGGLGSGGLGGSGGGLGGSGSGCVRACGRALGRILLCCIPIPHTIKRGRARRHRRAGPRWRWVVSTASCGLQCAPATGVVLAGPVEQSITYGTQAT